MPRNGALGSGTLSLLVTGTAGGLLGKILYQLKGPGLDGSQKNFEKPWASTLFMFLGMAACLPAVAAARRLQAWVRRLNPDEAAADTDNHSRHSSAAAAATSRQPLLERASGGSTASDTSRVSEASSLEASGPGALQAPPGSAAAGPSRRDLALVLIPTVFDLVASVLMSVGLLYITASVYQMMRGSEIVFAALLSTVWLRRHLNRWHLGGIALCMAGITLVGSASFLEGSDQPKAAAASGSTTLLGMLLVVAAEAVQAAQVVAEDYFMSSLSLAPLTVVGFEGVFGTLLTAGIMLPAVQLLPGREGGGIHEDSWDSLHMLAHSWHLRQVAAWFVVVMAVYNIAGMMVTDSLGAVTRTVLETIRTLFVWLLDLLFYYAGPAKGVQLGEPWTSHSWLQACGFAVLVAGALVYGHGEEVQERRLRAKLRWARLRGSLATLATRHEAARPLRPPRIAGPGRIRTAFMQRVVVDRLLERLAERKAPSVHGGAAIAAAGVAAGTHEGGRHLMEAGVAAAEAGLGQAASGDASTTAGSEASIAADQVPIQQPPVEELEP